MAITTLSTTDYHSLQIAKQRRNLLYSAAITLFAVIVLSVYLIPMAYGIVTSLQSKNQASDPKAPIVPMETETITYNGKPYELYRVPLESGEVKTLALFKKGNASSTFIDPQNVNAEPIKWKGSWRKLEAVREVSLKWENYPKA